MKRIVFAGLAMVLAACGTPVLQVDLTPRGTIAPIEADATPVKSPLPSLPTATITNPPQLIPTPVAAATLRSTFSNVNRSTDRLHLECDPLEIIFNVTVTDPNAETVIFFFRMKDKATGFVSNWSNGEEMKTPGNGNFEFILRAVTIPNEARYKDAWLQYQFVAVNKSQQNIGRSQIFADQITFTPDCP
jgi:hypothetical protein